MPAFEFSWSRNDAVTGAGLVQTQHGLDWPDGWDGEICLPSSLGGKAVTAVANSGFRGCPARAIVIPEGVTEIGEHAFNSCRMTAVSLPRTLLSIGPWAFYECKNLKSVVIPEGVTTIEYGAFQFCASLESVILPSSLTLIKNTAFEKCISLEAIAIPEGVTEIGFGAFYGCKHLERCTYPTTARVQERAFEGCPFAGSVLEEKPVRWTLADQLEAGREYSRYDWD